jgi:protein SCO1/2
MRHDEDMRHLGRPRPRRPAARLSAAGLLGILGATTLPHAGWARLTQVELARVAVAPAPDARVPLDLGVTDAETGPTTLGDTIGGRATLLLPVDYTCGNVCDPMLAMSAAALRATGLVPGRDVGFVLVGLDPKDGVEAARRLLLADAKTGEGAPARALVGDATAIARLTEALGYRYVVDREADSIAHPAAAILLAPDGRVARVLSPLALNGRDLRLALIEAGEGRGSTVGDRLTLLCYGYDAVRGVYTPLIERILSLAAGATVIVLGLGILALQRRSRRGPGV